MGREWINATLISFVFILLVYYRKKQYCKLFKPLGQIYQNELDVIKHYIKIVDTECTGYSYIDGKKIKRYTILIYYGDRHILNQIMSNIIKKSINFKGEQ